MSESNNDDGPNIRHEATRSNARLSRAFGGQLSSE
jgi:hypothetical protein